MIEIDSGIVDAEVLFDRVRATAKTKNISKEFYNTEDLYLTEVSLNKMHESMVNVYQNLQMMNATWAYEEKPLASVHPVVGKGIVFFKRAFRKLTRWLIQPIYQQQTEFNGAATRTLSDMIRVQEMLIQAYEESLKKEDADED